ncbi:MAG: hypothetical protein ACR2NU_10220 [Aeoliella sp.]
MEVRFPAPALSFILSVGKTDLLQFDFFLRASGWANRFGLRWLPARGGLIDQVENRLLPARGGVVARGEKRMFRNDGGQLHRG